MGSNTLLQCYRLGCQQMYNPEENTATSCTFHPGAPFFHDAYKGWSCCKKKCIDFTEFLNIKGCSKGFHSNEPPPEAEKKEAAPVKDTSQTEVSRPPVKAMERPDINTPMKPIIPTVAASLKSIVYATSNNNNTPDDVTSGVGEVKIGETCYNNGCKQTYEGPESNDTVCNYHPGVPIFHEGYKYWSCCNKKTTEFEVFQNQKGCSTGQHLWQKPIAESNDSAGNKVVKSRNDWIQTGANITVTIYAKKCDPSKSKILVNPVKLQVEIYLPEEEGYFRNTWILSGIVDIENCSASMTPNKIEITMKKAEPVYWSSLDISPERLERMNAAKQDSGVKSTGVEPVDLDDL